MNALVANDERRYNTDGGIRKATLVGDETVINLVEIATSTLTSLAQIDNNGGGVLALFNLGVVENLFQFSGQSLLSWDVDMNT